jgi:Uma2 family endonuclease
MTVMVHEPSQSGDELLLDAFLALDTPEGFRAEFIEGEIVVSPPPGGPHENVIASIEWQVARSSKIDMYSAGNKGLQLYRSEHCPKNYVIPDSVFVPRESGVLKSAGPWMPPDEVAMVLEVTSRNPERDREVKRRCYAKAEIPLYLLADQEKQAVTLFGDPDAAAEDYRQVVRVPFGKPLLLPDPFDFSLDTSDFG